MRKLAALLCLGLATCDEAPDDSFGPYLQSLKADSIVVCWVTGSATPSVVEYGTTPALGSTKIGAAAQYHQVKLTGLAPGTLYHYKAGYETGTFRTAGAATYTFVHFAEEHTAGWLEDWAPVVLAQDPLFAISAGDQVDWGLEFDEWKKYFDEGQAFWRHVPLFTILTNHTYVKKASTTFLNPDGDWIPVPGEPGKHMFKKVLHQPGNEEWYSVRFGPAQFIFLNGTYQMDAPTWILGEQLQWLQATLAAANDGVDDPAHLVVTFHYPPFGSAYTDPVMKTVFVPILEQYGVDLVLVGHEVISEHVKVNGLHYAQVSTGAVAGSIDAVSPDSLFLDNTHRTIGVATVTPAGITYKFVKLDGTVLHEFVVP